MLKRRGLYVFKVFPVRFSLQKLPQLFAAGQNQQFYLYQKISKIFTVTQVLCRYNMF